MATSSVEFQSKLRTVCVHLDSSAQITTSAPKDNNGDGLGFSPTDMLATSLASCMLTIVGIRAEKSAMNFIGGKALVTKHMEAHPRRVAQIDVELTLEGDLSEKDKVILTEAALQCPVAKSLHPDVNQNVQIVFS